MTALQVAWLSSTIAISFVIFYLIDTTKYRKLKREFLSLEVKYSLEKQNRVKADNEVKRLKDKVNQQTIEKSTPFSEPIHQCKYCGSDNIRETDYYYICQDCKRRERK